MLFVNITFEENYRHWKRVVDNFLGTAASYSCCLTSASRWPLNAITQSGVSSIFPKNYPVMILVSRISFFGRHAYFILAVAGLSFRLTVAAAMPDYKAGEVAAEDVITPIRLLVANPEATDTLKHEVADRIPVVMRRTTPSAAEAEAELRAALAAARIRFLSSLNIALGGRPTTAAEVGSEFYRETLRKVSLDGPPNLPFAQLAPIWVSGFTDETVIEGLLQPLRQVMASPIVAERDERTLPADQPVRLIQVQRATDFPSLQELESFGETMPASKLLLLAQARRLVETSFPAGQEEMARFVAGFVRNNTFSAPGLTEILRVRRIDGITVSDTYETGQTVVKKGQTIDRRILAALTILREKNLVGTLQAKLDQEQVVAGMRADQIRWLTVALGGAGLMLLVALLRRKTRPVEASALSAPGNQVMAISVSTSSPTIVGTTTGVNWRETALLTETNENHVREAVRQGVIGWMREKLVHTLFSDRAELLAVHRQAEAEIRLLEQRLEKFNVAVQDRFSIYEKRIAELEGELSAKGELNRELIGAKIEVVKERLSVERERLGIS